MAMLFEFLRNTDLDARNYFSPTRGAFDQNQFGGTFGGPIRKNIAFSSSPIIRAPALTQGIDTGRDPGSFAGRSAVAICPTSRVRS